MERVEKRMSKELIIIGLIFDFFGVSILILVSLFGKWHQKNYTNHWTKRYWWMGWRPIFKVSPPNKKSKWMIKPKHKVVRYGFIPPKNLWNSIGFAIIGLGFILQIIGNMN